MFGLNKYIAVALIALVVGFSGLVTWRVVEHVKLAERADRQEAVINTVDTTTKAVAKAEEQLNAGADLDKALCAKGWMANCHDLQKPQIAQLINSAALADDPPAPAPPPAPPISDEKVATTKLSACKTVDCRRALRDREREASSAKRKRAEGTGVLSRSDAHTGPTFGVMPHPVK